MTLDDAPVASSLMAHSPVDNASMHALAIVMRAAAASLRAIADAALVEIETARGDRYSNAYRHRRLAEFVAAATPIVAARVGAALVELKSRIRVPAEPTDAMEGYRASLTRYEMAVWRHRIGSEAPPPPKPESIVAYERQCEAFVESVRDLAASLSWDWTSVPFRELVAAEIARGAQGRARPNTPRVERRRGEKMRPASFLVGGECEWDADDTEPSDARDAKTTARARAQALLGVRLVFGDEILAAQGSVAHRARRSERGDHRLRVQAMVGVLRGLGYIVYPGDVGIEGVYAMADLVAVRDEDVLFVECLSKASIKLGSHERKLSLAERVPFCFVGALPEAFVKALPPRAFAIGHPNSARMSGGPMIPYFWRRDETAAVVLDVSLKRGRTMTTIAFAMPVLRRADDVAGFLWACVAPGLLALPGAGWTLRFPRTPLGRVPFERVGLPDSSLRLSSGASDLLLRLGRIPMIGELRGSRAALDQLLEAVRASGIAVREFAR